MSDRLLIHRRSSMRGRTRIAAAYWTWNGIENVIQYNWNKMWDWLQEEGLTKEPEIITAFVCIDFHEWLHIWIRRNTPNSYIVTDSCEEFICRAEIELFKKLYPDICSEDLIVQDFTLRMVSGEQYTDPDA